MKLEQINGGEFRYYRYDPEDGSPTTDLLSVTSIRSLCGESYNLVNWKLANMADAALGTMKRTVVGPRGGLKDVRQVWEFPSEFARRYADTEGEQARIDGLRKWLRDRADEPRNVAAIRGTLTHDAIEHNVMWDRIERPYVEAQFAALSGREQKKVAGITDEDVFFVQNSVRWYWDMRERVPMVILAREVRVVNVEVGYAGTFDALAWLLGTYDSEGNFTPLPDDKIAEARAIPADKVTVEDIERIGGVIVMLDWKTATGIHTDYVVQCHAYLAAEFAVVNEVRDERITRLLTEAGVGGLVHIRPNGWKLHLFPFRDDIVRAFLGSVAFARFLARFPEPGPIFAATLKSTDEEVSE